MSRREKRKRQFDMPPTVPDEGTEMAFIGDGCREVVVIVDAGSDSETASQFARFVRADGSTDWRLYNGRNFAPVQASDFPNF